MASGSDIQFAANGPKFPAVRTRFFAEPGMDDGVGHLVEYDLPYIGLFAHRKQP